MATNLKKIKQPIEVSNFNNFVEPGHITSEVATLKFTKKQIVASNKYSYRQDALNVLLEEGKLYTFGEVDQKLNDFLKGKVNE